MAAGLEAREPFLDHHLAEWANSLSAEVKLAGGVRKSLLKNIALKWLPSEIVNRRKVGLPVTVFVSVRTGQHDAKWLDRFAAAVMALPEVQEFHRMSGDVDYLLKVVTTDIEGYDRFYKKLIKTAQLAGVSSAFSMEQIKYSTALPLELISHGLPA